MSIIPSNAPYRPAYVQDASTGLYYRIGGGGGSAATYVGPEAPEPNAADYNQWVVTPTAEKAVAEGTYTLRISDGTQWYQIAGGGGGGSGVGEPPVPSFTFTTHWTTVSANAAATSDPDGWISNYLWVWGDGTQDQGEFLTSAQHTYANSGTYAVRLTVTDNDGNSRSSIQQASVTRMYGPVEFTTDTTATTFDPKVYLYGSESGIITEWINPVDGTTVGTGLTPHITFGTTAEHRVQMWTSHPDQVRTVNIGYFVGHDSGIFFPAGLPDPSHYNHLAQRIKKVTGLQVLTALENFMCAGGRGGYFDENHQPQGGYNPQARGWYDAPIDYTGLASLRFIETAYNGVTDVTLTGCTSLVRLCMEENRIASEPNGAILDLMPVRTTLRDLRCAFQTRVDFTSLTQPIPQLWHWCTRDEQLVNPPLDMATLLPNVEEYWTWNTGSTGTLIFSPKILDARVYANQLSTLDFRQVTSKPSNGNFDASNNPLTSVLGLATATRFNNLYFTNCSMSQALVDQILANVNAWGDSSGYVGGRTLGLLGNASPTGGQNNTDRLALVARNWVVSVA